MSKITAKGQNCRWYLTLIPSTLNSTNNKKREKADFVFETEEALDQFLAKLLVATGNLEGVDSSIAPEFTDEELEQLDKKNLIVTDADGKPKLKEISRIKLGKEGGKTFFSLANPKDNTVNILKEMSEAIQKNPNTKVIVSNTPNADGVVESYTYMGATSFGTNRVQGLLGNRDNWLQPMLPAMDSTDWRKHEKERLIEQETDVERTEEDRENICKAQENSWEVIKSIGTDIHALIESTLKGEEAPNVTNLTPDQISYVQGQARNLIKLLKGCYGENCVILTETDIVSKELNEEFKEIAKAKGIDIESINGRIDLCVIDEAGEAHLFDYKVAKKDVGNWNIKDATLIKGDEWSSEKKQAVTNQLAIYAQILKQHGITVSSTAIIPIKADLEYNDAGLVTIGDEKYNAVRLKKNGVKFDLTEVNKKKPNEPWSEVMKRCHIFDISSDTLVGANYRNIAKILPAGEISSSEAVKKTHKTFNQIFPGTNIAQRDAVKTGKTLNVEDYLKGKISGRRVVVNDDGTYLFRGKNYATKEDLTKAIENDILNIERDRDNEIINYANQVKAACTTHDPLKLNFGKSTKTTACVRKALEKYTGEGWHMISSVEESAAGIFIFQKESQIEIQVITNQDITRQNNFTLGSTILGEKLEDKYTGGAMKALNGNLEGLRALIYIASNQDRFRGMQVRTLRVLNPWYEQALNTVMNYKWLEAYDKLRFQYKELSLPSLNNRLFMPTDQALLQLARDEVEQITDPCEIGKSLAPDKIEYDASKIKISRDWVVTMLQQMEKDDAFKSQGVYGTDYQKSHAWEAKQYLHALLMYLEGVEYTTEADRGQFREGGNLTRGLYSAGTQFNSSKNIQACDTIIQRRSQEIVDKTMNSLHAFRTQLIKVEKTAKYTGRDLFRQFLRRTPDGSLDERLLFIDPKDFTGGEEEKKLLQIILDTIYYTRFPNKKGNAAQLKEDKANLIYYELPLVKAAGVQRMFEREGGLGKTFKEWVDRLNNARMELVSEDSAEAVENLANNFKTFNPFDVSGEDRMRKLKEHGRDFWELNLETVVAEAVLAWTKTNVSYKYDLMCKGIRIMARRDEVLNGISMGNTLDAIDKTLTKGVYENPIMKKENLALYHVASEVLKPFKVLRLGVNTASFVREIVSGVYNGLTRAATKYVPGLTSENYAKAISFILQDLPENASGISIVQQLNGSYRMANYSAGNIVDNMQVNWVKPRKYSESTLFLGCSSPDYQHRIALLIAKMMSDGCWDAHSMDENKQLKYDMYKDDRFKVFFAKDTKNPKYMEQKSLYYKYVDEWSKLAPLKKDDKGNWIIPKAYPEKEALSIKAYGDLLYGHYDKETSAIMGDLFLGSFFMMFKTFVNAKFEQWFMKGDVYTTGSYQEIKDPSTGELMYERILEMGDDGIAFPQKVVITESEWKALPAEEQQEYNIAYEWNGDPMEGIFFALLKTGKALFTDWNKFNELMNDPKNKQLLALALSDLGFLSLIMMLVTLLFAKGLDTEDINPTTVRKALKKEGGYAENFVYKVLTGAIDDYNPYKMLSGMTNIAGWSMVKNQYDNTMRFICGSDTAFQFASNSVGGLAEFRGIANALNSD